MATYVGNDSALIQLPGDEIVVQPWGLATLRRKYACAATYATTAGNLLSIGSNPIMGTLTDGDAAIGTYFSTTVANSVSIPTPGITSSGGIPSGNTSFSITSGTTFYRVGTGWVSAPTTLSSGAFYFNVNGSVYSSNWKRYYRFVPSAQYGWVLQVEFHDPNTGSTANVSQLCVPAAGYASASSPRRVGTWTPTLTLPAYGGDTTDYALLGLFRKPAISTDGVVTLFTCDYIGVLSDADFGRYYDTFSSEIHQYVWDTVSGSYVAPVMTRKFVIPAGVSLSINMPTYAQVAADGVVITDLANASGVTGGGVGSPTITTTTAAGAPALNTFNNYDNTSPTTAYLTEVDAIDPATILVSVHGIEQVNYGVVQEITVKFGISTPYG